MQIGKYKAVVFDLDGTAVNSHYNIDALQMTCIELLDREATDEELKITYGMTAVNAMRYLGVPEDQFWKALAGTHHAAGQARHPL